MAATTSAITNNVIWAEKALKYTGETLTMGAINRWEDIKRSKGAVLFAAPFMRVRTVAATIDAVRNKGTMKQLLLDMASIAEKAGCGNCAEQSAVAFSYLYHRRGHGGCPSIIEAMRFANGDHAFVVVGRAADSDAAVPATWGPDAVVCDAWLKKVFLPIEWVKYWPGMTPELECRVE